MKKMLLLVAAAFAFVVAAVAQAPEITFDKMVHDFGTFPEETGKVSCTFEFTNSGTADLILQKVKASCGCTTPEWTKTPVKPGEKGVVTATYNASGRPGAFTKTITVTSNAGDKRLTIKGEVTPKAQKIEDQYQVDMDGLRLKKQHVYFNSINYPDSKTERISIVNNTKSDMSISFKGVPSYVNVVASPAKLKAGEKGTIDVEYNSKNSDEWGSFSENFFVVVNGKSVEDKKYQVGIHGSVVENFSAMTAEQKANAPVIELSNTVTLGTIKSGAKKTFKFPVKNSGKSELYVRKVSSDSKAINLSAPSKPIKAGKDGDIKLTIDTKDMASGKFSYRVTVISNDPNKSVNTIQIIGEIK